MNKTLKLKDDLGEELCKYCPLEENQKGVYYTPNSMSAGCEGSRCDDAYEAYQEDYQTEKVFEGDDKINTKKPTSYSNLKAAVFAKDVWKDDDYAGERM